MNEQLTDREINTKFETTAEANKLAHFSMNEKLDKILIQTTEHNHRMSKIELWRSLLIGGWIMVTMFVIPLVVYASNLQNQRLDEKIDNNQQEIKKLLNN